MLAQTTSDLTPVELKHALSLYQAILDKGLMTADRPASELKDLLVLYYPIFAPKKRKLVVWYWQGVIDDHWYYHTNEEGAQVMDFDDGELDSGTAKERLQSDFPGAITSYQPRGKCIPNEVGGSHALS